MSAYMVIRCVIHDREQFGAYAGRAAALVEKYGGRYVVMGGEPQMLEGSFGDGVFVVSQWPSREAAERFWHSDEYQDVKALREDNATADVMLVSGQE